MIGSDPTALYVGPDTNPDRYQLGNRVGSGAEGEIYQGFAPTADTFSKVAIKMYPGLSAPTGTDATTEALDAASDPRLDAIAADWQRQLDLVHALQHPSIVTYRETFAGAGPHRTGQPGRGRHVYLVMNWVDGETLLHWLASRPAATYAERATVIQAVAGAVAYMHSGKDTGGVPVLHRDLKPSNIMIRPDGRVVVIDFGIARGAIRGPDPARTPAYAAPEAAFGQFSPHSDLYSLAAVACYLFTGAPPPVQQGFDTTRAALAASPLLAAQPRVVDHLLAALTPDPTQRPGDVERWARGLTDLLTTIGPATAEHEAAAFAATLTPTAAPGTAGTSPKRRRIGWWLAAAAAIAATILLAATLLGDDDNDGTEAAVPQETTTTTSTTSTTTTSRTTTRPTTTTTTARPTTTTTTQPPSTTTTTAKPAKSLTDFTLNTSQPECDNEGLGVGWSTFITPTVAGQSAGDALWVTPDWQSGIPACGEVALGGTYTTMTGWVGVTDKFPSGSQVRLTFLGDGQQLASFEPQLGERLPLDIDVTGVKVLRMNAELLASSTESSLDNIAINAQLG